MTVLANGINFNIYINDFYVNCYIFSTLNYPFGTYYSNVSNNYFVVQFNDLFN